MKTLWRFIEKADMDFVKAAESAVAKRKFLLNRLMQKKPLSDEWDDDKEEENDTLLPKTWISHVTLIRTSRFLKTRRKRWYEINKVQLVNVRKAYCQQNKEHITNYRRQYLKNNRERINEQRKSYYAKNKEQINQRLRNQNGKKNRGSRPIVWETGNESLSEDLMTIGSKTQLIPADLLYPLVNSLAVIVRSDRWTRTSPLPYF